MSAWIRSQVGESGLRTGRRVTVLLWTAPAPLASPRPAPPAGVAVRRDFWTLVEEFSEPDGYFQSENLVGNERPSSTSCPRSRRCAAATRISASRPTRTSPTSSRSSQRRVHRGHQARQPAVAPDVQGALRAVDDRAEFLSRLFARPRPAGLDAGTPVNDLFDAYWEIESDAELNAATSRAITRAADGDARISLSSDDLAGIGGDLCDVLRTDRR